MHIIIGIFDICFGLTNIAISIPLFKEKVKMNHLYGIRFAKSFESEENWYKINKHGAKRSVVWSIPIVIIGTITLLPPLYNSVAGIVLAAVAPLIILIADIESYLYARKL